MLLCCLFPRLHEENSFELFIRLLCIHLGRSVDGSTSRPGGGITQEWKQMKGRLVIFLVSSNVMLYWVHSISSLPATPSKSDFARDVPGNWVQTPFCRNFTTEIAFPFALVWLH